MCVFSLLLYIILGETDALSLGNCHNGLSSFLKGVYSKRKANSKVVSLSKRTENLPSVSIHLKYFMLETNVFIITFHSINHIVLN